MLTADDYGFHHGDVWYRGRFTGDGAAPRSTWRYGGGGAGMVQVWLDGAYLGQNVLPTGLARRRPRGTATFTIPAALQHRRRHTCCRSWSATTATTRTAASTTRTRRPAA